MELAPPKLGTAEDFAVVREQPFVVALLQAHDASRVGSPIGAVPPMVAEACVQGDEERVLTWLQCGGQVDAKHIGDDGECTLLLLACEAGWSSLVSKLIDLGADTTVTRSKDKATAMLLAAHNGHREVVRILLRPKRPWLRPPPGSLGTPAHRAAPAPLASSDKLTKSASHAALGEQRAPPISPTKSEPAS